MAPLVLISLHPFKVEVLLREVESSIAKVDHEGKLEYVIEQVPRGVALVDKLLILITDNGHHQDHTVGEGVEDRNKERREVWV